MHVMFDNDIFNSGINVLIIKVVLMTETYACQDLLGMFVTAINSLKEYEYYTKY